MTILMDYEGYTFVFFIIKINKFFSLKCDIYYAFTFKPSKNRFKMQVAYICLNKLKREVILHLITSLEYE